MQTTTFLSDQQSLNTHYGVGSATNTSSEKPPVSVETPSDATAPVLPPDAREQLFNGGEVGPITHVQVSTERITQLNGILFDLDPQNLLSGPLLPALSHDPEQFYEQCVQPWLVNDPVLQHMEVRISGTGLHAILWLDPPIEFTDDDERKRWCSITKCVQAALPTDPCAPALLRRPGRWVASMAKMAS